MNPEKIARLASIVLAATTLVSDYVVMVVGDITAALFRAAFRGGAATDAQLLVPAITNAAIEHRLIFVIASALVTFATVLLLHRFPKRAIRLLTVGLCSQGLVVWIAMFCYGYDGLTGGVSMHHGPSLSFDAFFHLASGAFPVTLLAILVPFSSALFFHGEDAQIRRRRPWKKWRRFVPRSL